MPLIGRVMDDNLVFNQELKGLTQAINNFSDQTAEALTGFAQALGLSPETLLHDIENGAPITEVVQRALFDANLPEETMMRLMPLIGRVMDDNLVFNQELKGLTQAINNFSDQTAEALTGFAQALGLPPERLLVDIQNGMPLSEAIHRALFDANLPDEMSESLEPLLDSIMNDDLVFDHEINALTNAITRVSISEP